MPDYIAPLKEIRFVLTELADLADICSLPGLEDTPEDVLAAILEEAGKFSQGVLAPLNIAGDRNGAVCEGNAVRETAEFRQAYRQFAEGGWVALPSNVRYGGMGLPECIAMATMEMTTSANMSFALCPMLSQGAIEAIYHHASETLKSVYLPNLISGKWTGTMNLTEPQAGSDLAVVRTRATPKDDHYLITGTKIFITWGDHQMTDNIVHLVLARTPDAPEGVKGISLFIVPKFIVNKDGSLGERNDIYATSVEHKLGIHGSPTCVMNYGDNKGAIGYLVGEENQGLAYMFTMMNHARLSVGTQGVAQSERAYQLAAAYARERIQGAPPAGHPGAPIINHPDVRRMLMQMRALTEASRALCYVATACFDFARHGRDDRERELSLAKGEFLTPIAKGWSTEVAQEVTSLCMQVHGGMGYIEETGAAQLFRDVRITTIYEGTTAIQANDLVGRKFIRDSGRQLQQLLDEIEITQSILTVSGEPFSEIALELGQAIEALQTLANQLLKHHQQDANLPGAVSYNFLMAAGTIVGGWLLAKGALAARAKQDKDPDFYTAKLATAHFYNEQILPRAISHIKAGKGGSGAIMALDERFFDIF